MIPEADCYLEYFERSRVWPIPPGNVIQEKDWQETDAVPNDLEVEGTASTKQPCVARSKFLRVIAHSVTAPVIVLT